MQSLALIAAPQLVTSSLLDETRPPSRKFGRPSVSTANSKVQMSPLANRSSDGNLLWPLSWNRPDNTGYNDSYADRLRSLDIECD